MRDKKGWCLAIKDAAKSVCGQDEIVWNFSDGLKKLMLDLKGGERNGR